jgi:hypothetical protein
MGLLTPAPTQSPPKWEFAVVLLVILAFLGFSLATYIDYPEVWCDEIWFSEPAVNFAHGGSFTTMVWQYQEPGTFPVVNCPLYLVALVPWLSLAGTTVLAVRSFNYALMGIAAFLVWVVSWRFNLVKSSIQRLLILPLLYLGYGMSFSYRCSRPDILALICLLLLLLAFLIRSQPLRNACLVVLSALTVCIGFQVAIFAWFACFAAWLVLRQAGVRELTLLSAGMAMATGSILLFFTWKGVLSPFLTIVFGILGKHYAHVPHLSAGGALLRLIHYSLISYVDDFSASAIILGLAFLLATTWKRLSHTTRRFVIYCLVLLFGVPPLFNLIGHFAFYYSYMRFVPAVLAIFAVHSELSSTSSGLRPMLRLVFPATLAVAMMVGLPLRLAVTAATAKVAPRQEIQRIVSSAIRPDDVVLCDYAYFFEVKRAARSVYDRFCSPVLCPSVIPGGRDLTPEQRESITVLVIRPNEKETLQRYFGHQWAAISAPFGDSFEPGILGRLPVIGNRMIHYLNQRQTERYQLQIFRRLPASSEIHSAGAILH